MAKTKAEMQEDHSSYHALLAKARSEINAGRFDHAVKTASNAWAYFDGMMQFERKYQNAEAANIETIEIALEYAPVVFEFRILDELENLLKSNRKISKAASVDLGGKVSNARARMQSARCLWNHLEEQGSCASEEICSKLGGSKHEWDSITAVWELMGLVFRIERDNSPHLVLATNSQAEAKAKCPSCGVVARSAKANFLKNQVCPKCKSQVSFVFVSHITDGRK